MLNLKTSLSEIYGIGPKFLERFKNFKIETVGDLLLHFPFRYEDFSQIYKIAELKAGQQATVQGIITEISLHRTWQRRMVLVEALISDKTGSIRAIWFNQPYLKDILREGRLANFAGKISLSKNKLYLSNPIYEILNEENEEEETKHTGRLVPIYPETKGLTSKGIRYLIKPILENLEKIPEFLPASVLKKNNLPEINSAIQKIHFPENLKEAREAKKRFAFEDLFFLQLSNILQRLKLNQKKAVPLKIDIEWLKEIINHLPFELTLSQKQSLWEIVQDLEKNHPMNRLLQGDVGSGKTIVAALAALASAEENHQSVFMAPTEILAHQHYQTFIKFFPDFEKGLALITSAQTKVFYGDGLETEIKKSELLEKIALGKIKIIIGTHALIQKGVVFNDLVFVVIDEQHRFGVSQRAKLLKKNKLIPHFLSMSATPIPRTLSLSIFGDLDLSTITELPKNRKAIVTKVVAPTNRDKAYAFIRGQVKKGRQVFVICPRIDADTQIDANNNIRINQLNQYKSALLLETKAVKEEYEKLKNKIFPDLRVAMLHGKIKSKDKELIMNKFKDGETDILVSTSVVEVGVDIPNAVIMMIEGAERFGLAQLYQFRGRVGRGVYQSFCFLFTDSSAKTTQQRLQSIVEAKNGLELAEKDLEIRGPGEFLGKNQTGVPDLAMKAIQNPELVKNSRKAALEILQKDPKLIAYPLLKEKLKKFSKEVHLE
ncbi:MAG: ATP-dependent DNA helicase RecG [bacterium]|nr:ATP-dependent DNA helicase RecG [bacterium]